jgi:hypothetical protein
VVGESSGYKRNANQNSCLMYGVQDSNEGEKYKRDDVSQWYLSIICYVRMISRLSHIDVVRRCEAGLANEVGTQTPSAHYILPCPGHI